MFNAIDNFLNKTTMYRVVVYYCVSLLVIASVFGYFDMMPYSAVSILFSTLFISFISWVTNRIFAWAFNAPVNIESVYITALILALIITPPKGMDDTNYFILALWASIWAMASKYIFALGKKHIFNPAAFGVAITSLVLGLSASWWVGTVLMAPFVFAGGLMMVKKILRWDLVLSFLIVASFVILSPNVNGTFEYFYNTLSHMLLRAPLLFLAFIMLTEPLTTPPTRFLRIAYGALVGLLFSPSIHIGSLYSTPELALLVGNIFTYMVSPKTKLLLQLKEIIHSADGVLDFVFQSEKRLAFRPGQYLEWTLPHTGGDARGNRRYFTIASSPTENDLRIGVKFYPHPSSFKKNLELMQTNDIIVGSQLSGDFTLPKNPNKKLAFIAGGIGVTPFRSMIKYCIDTGEKRDIVLLYSNRAVGDIAYTDVFNQASQQLGIKTVFTLTDNDNIPLDWQGRKGMFDERLIAEEIPDFKERTFYLSGPHAMVEGYQDVLLWMGVKQWRIKKDYFPGF